MQEEGKPGRAPRLAKPQPPRLTKPLEGISHGLVLHHVDEASAKAEVGEDEENLLQDAVDVVEFLWRR